MENELLIKTGKELMLSSGHLPSAEYQRIESPFDTDGDTSLRDYVEVLIRRRWIIITTLCVAFFTALVFTLSATKTYRSIATIEISQHAPKVTKFEEVVDSAFQTREFYETQVALLESKALVERVANRLNLAEHPMIIRDVIEGSNSNALMGFYHVIRSFLAKGPQEGSDLPSEVLQREKISEYLMRNLNVETQRRAMLLSLFFTSADRRLSRDILDALVDEFINWEMDKRIEATGTARRYLDRRIEEAKINLERAEEAMNRYAEEAGIVSLDSKLNSIYAQLEEMNRAIADANAERIAKEAMYRGAQANGPEFLPQVLDSELISQLKSILARVSSDYEELSVSFKDDYPKVKILKARMADITKRIRVEEQKIANAVAADYRTASEKVATLQKSLEAQNRKALALNQKASHYRILEREVQSTKEVYQSLLERAREIESMAGVVASRVQLVDRASLPILPHSPNVFFNLGLAVVLGLALGMAGAFIREHFADTLTGPDEIAEQFDIPVLGVVPQMEQKGGPLEMSMVEDPRSHLSEGVRTARVSIQLTGANDMRRSVVLTSTAAGEGKTTMAVNLATAFANTGERVVLIDGDLRKPRLHQVFQVRNDAMKMGLSGMLAGLANKITVTRTSIKNLDLLPAGPLPPNPVDLLASSRFERLMQYLSQKYDRIIIDAPPLYGFADVLVLSQSVGGVILVTSLEKTTRIALKHFKTAMANIGSVVLGCIVNKVETGIGRYGYCQSYTYYGNYTHGPEATPPPQEMRRPVLASGR